jgi:NTE family protein
MVLAGGAARGAYEVGVVQYIVDELGAELGRPPPLDILCGTSVGAINACALAASADDPTGRADRLAKQWTELRLSDVLRIDTVEVLGILRSLVGRPRAMRKGGIIDPAGLERVVTRTIPFAKIPDHLRAGLLDAVTVSTTHIASGKTVVYVDRAVPDLPEWGHDPTILARRTHLTARHALASAAIPFLFPPVLLDDAYHCDGGLRQNVPLSPARKLGASAMVVVSPKYESALAPPPALAAEREAKFPSPMFLLGKTLNALMLDRIENDIDRLQGISALLEAGERRYGAEFVDTINRDLGRGPKPRRLRPIRAVLIRSSVNIAELAAAYVHTPAFDARVNGVWARLLRRIGEGRESDILSYLLFDGSFARQLIEHGRADARAHREMLGALFESVLAMEQP